MCVCGGGGTECLLCACTRLITAFIGSSKLSVRLFGAGVAMEVMDACNVARAAEGRILDENVGC